VPALLSFVIVEVQLHVKRCSTLQLLHGFGGEGRTNTCCFLWLGLSPLQVIHSTDLATLEAVAAMPVPSPAFKQLPGPSPEEAAAEAAATAAAAAASGVPMRCGGRLLRGGSSSSKQHDVSAELKLRVLIDGSCVEVFAGGQALGTRVYRGDEHPLDHIQSTAELAAEMNALTEDSAAAHSMLSSSSSSGSGAIQLVCFGDGPAQLLSASVWQMNSMWLPDVVAQQQQQLKELMPAAATAAAQVLQGLVAAEAAAVATAAAAAVVLPVGELSLSVPVGEAEVAALSPRDAAAVPVEAV
jgi:hypothetical protein